MKFILIYFSHRPDASKIFVFVGYGFFVEFTLDEALRFIDKRNKFLTEHTDRLTKDAAKVKANIKLVIEVSKGPDITIFLSRKL